jgi:hypothetical protein
VNQRLGEMKRASFVIFIIFILLHIEAQAQSYSILTGIVTEFHRRALVVKSDEGGVVQLRVGRRTVYPNRIPAVGDKVTVEYSIIRRVYVGYSVTILENTKKEIEPQKKVIEKRPPLPSNLPPEILGFVGKWEGFWDNIKDYGFTLTISNINLKLEVAEVKYESKDLQLSEKANVIPGEKPRIEWMINSVVNPESPFASPSKGYFDIISESIPIYYTFEIQKGNILKGTFDSQRMSTLGTSRMAVLRRVD